MSEDNKTLIAVALLVSFGLVTLLVSSKTGRDDKSADESRARENFPQVTLAAKGAYVYDVRSEIVLFAKNSDKPLPLASLAKLMSALVAEETYYDYGSVTISSEAIATDGDSGLVVGEKWRLKELLDFSLVASSNDGIKAVALTLGDRDFIRAMNRRSEDLGLDNTLFNNETGLDLPAGQGQAGLEGSAGGYGSARDIAVLLRHILERYPEALEATKFESTEVSSLDGSSYTVRNTNRLVGEIPGLLASKTGYTSMAGGNIVFAFDPELGRPIIVVVLGSSVEGRFADADKLVKATMVYINGN